MNGMKRWRLIAGPGVACFLAGCITHTHQENAALPQPWPEAPNLAAYAKGAADDPSVGGDILNGYTPAELAAARAAATKTPAEPDPH